MIKRNRITELWVNRPSKYIPSVVKMMRRHPLEKGDNVVLWVRNMLYLNWQYAHNFKQEG